MRSRFRRFFTRFAQRCPCVSGFVPFIPRTDRGAEAVERRCTLGSCRRVKLTNESDFDDTRLVSSPSRRPSLSSLRHSDARSVVFAGGHVARVVLAPTARRPFGRGVSPRGVLALRPRRQRLREQGRARLHLSDLGALDGLHPADAAAALDAAYRPSDDSRDGGVDVAALESFVTAVSRVPRARVPAPRDFPRTFTPRAASAPPSATRSSANAPRNTRKR